LPVGALATSACGSRKRRRQLHPHRFAAFDREFATVPSLARFSYSVTWGLLNEGG
jgi:hypothetical protein